MHTDAVAMERLKGTTCFIENEKEEESLFSTSNDRSVHCIILAL